MKKAELGDGWCVDCVNACSIGSVSMFLLRESGREDVTTHYCQEHREFVEVDETCKSWMKQG